MLWKTLFKKTKQKADTKMTMKLKVLYEQNKKIRIELILTNCTCYCCSAL